MHCKLLNNRGERVSNRGCEDRKVTCLVVGIIGRGEGKWREQRRVNIVDVFCIHVWKYNNETCWNSSKKRGEWERGMNLIKIYWKHICKCYNVSSLYNYYKLIKFFLNDNGGWGEKNKLKIHWENSICLCFKICCTLRNVILSFLFIGRVFYNITLCF
jgi:hypothetical protein